MRLRKLSSLYPWFVAGALAVATGCTTSVGTIDRTQPDLFEKSEFDGQWFIRQSVVDVPNTSVTTFIGEMGGTDSLVWDIQRDYLVGYRSYEQTPGGDDSADTANADVSEQPVVDDQGEGRDPTIYKGNPVVAYPIEAHVDIQREYNARTGEQTNVISENTTDRPWYERGFMRVDWSASEVDNFLMFSAQECDPTRPFSDPNRCQDASTFATFIPQNEGGQDALFMERDESGELAYMDFTSRIVVGPSVASCARYLRQSEIGDCTSDEIRVRTSLLKVDPEREQDYVPLTYDDRQQGEFGYFRTLRPTYDRGRGNTQTGVIRLADRHEIWAQSHDADGNELPYAERTLRTVDYTLSKDFPADLIPITEDIAAEYDGILKEVAATAREQSIDELMDDLRKDTGADCLFCLDLNNAEDSLDRARIGDLRRNFIYWVEDPQRLGPLGYGPSSPHPETGRMVSSAAYIYGAGIDRTAEFALDIIRLLNGELTNEDLVDGAYIRNVVQGGLKPIDPRALEAFEGMDLEQAANAVLGSAVTNVALARSKEEGLGIPRARPGFEQAQLERIQGSTLETLLIPSEELPLFDPQNTLALTADADTLASPLGALSIANWGTTEAIQRLAALDQIASERSLWLQDFSDPAIVGLARELAERDLSLSEMRQFLREQIYRAVMLHEIGHTVGLRHNFGASGDPLNFGPEYWDMRMLTAPDTNRDCGLGAQCLDAWLYSNCSMIDDRNQEACEEQQAGRMQEYQYTSIMDYGGRFNSDFNGLGLYDRAAMAAGYGDLVEVWEDEVTDAMTPDLRDAIRFVGTLTAPVLGQGIETQFGAHYTELPDILGGTDNLYRRRLIPRSEYDAQDTEGPVRVPYMACYDEYVDAVETCHRWDQGADAYEITSDYMQRYREYYVFNNFQRDQVGFNGNAVLQRVAQRYLLPLTNMYQHWLFQGRSPSTPSGALAQVAAVEGFNTLLNVVSTPSYGSFEDGDGDGLFDLLSTQEGVYGVYQDADGDGVRELVGVQQGVPDPDVPHIEVARGLGRTEFSRFDIDAGGYNLFQRVTEAGHFYDRLAALVALTSSDARVVGVGSDVQADALSFSIPYYLIFSDDMDGFLGSVFGQNYQGYAMGMVDGAVRGRSVFVNPAEPVDGYLRPSLTWNSRILTGLYGMAFLQSNYDIGFVQQGQISLLGTGEAIEPAEGFEAVVVDDPFQGRRYVAYRELDSGNANAWYGAAMLEKISVMVDEYQEISAADPEDTRLGGLQGRIQFELTNIEIVRSMYLAFNQNFQLEGLTR